MTQVTSGSDIWSVGCLILELLTGYPPYFDLQPMSALFRIVQVGRRAGGGWRGPCASASADSRRTRVPEGRRNLCWAHPPVPRPRRPPQDEHPPLPDNVSPLLADFLLQCFHKVGQPPHCMRSGSLVFSWVD